MDKKKAVAVLGTLGLGALTYFALKPEEVSGEQPAPTPPPTPIPECNEGEQKCVGYDLYVCQNGKWVLKEKNSPSCGYTPPECTEGEQKCIGYDLYECQNGKWVLKEINSPACGYVPPTPECNEGERKCVGYDLYVCQNGKWVLIEQNSPSCGAPPSNVFEGAYRCYGGNELQRYENGQWVSVEWNSPLCLGKETNYYAFGRVGEEWLGAYFEKVSAPPTDKIVRIADATMQFMKESIGFNGSFYVYPDEFRQTGLCYIYFHSDKFYKGTWWKSTKIFNYCIEHQL